MLSGLNAALGPGNKLVLRLSGAVRDGRPMRHFPPALVTLM